MRFAGLFFAASLLACSGGDEGSPDGDVDGSVDAGFDATAVDSGSDTTIPEGGEPCTAGNSESRACGYCGTESRTCPSGVWSAWSTCAGQDFTLECRVGETHSHGCGKCGIAIDTCDTSSCMYVHGACNGAKDCDPGEVDTDTTTCAAGEIRTRTCDATCGWGAYSDCALPKGWVKMAATTLIDARYEHSAVWTGTEMIVWGGYGAVPAYGRKNGAAYDLSTDSWRAISSALPAALTNGRYLHTAVWTGSQMIVWGGYDPTYGYKNDGGVYDPTADAWTAMATSPLTGRFGHGAVWSTTTNEMIVWGGYGACGGAYCGDGASYDPVTDKWTMLPSAPLSGRFRHTMVWTGSELVIWGGGTVASGPFFRDGARYDPKTKIWTKIPEPIDLDARWDQASVWNGTELFVWGGYGAYVAPSYARSNGARYTPGGSWTTFATPPIDAFGMGTLSARFASQAWFGGGKLFLWAGGGGSSVSGPAASGGAIYDPATDTWATLDMTGAPTARARASVVWTGKEALVWGGANSAAGGVYFGDGAAYRP